MAPVVLSVEALRARTGSEIGVSDWIIVDQPRINAFADVTEDRQFIHCDPVRAEQETPFGGTIAHGFLTLSLVSAMALDVMPEIEKTVMTVNYGLDRVRFLTPVLSGQSIRGRFVLEDVIDKPGHRVMTRYGVSVEIRGVEKPALSALWICLAQLESGH